MYEFWYDYIKPKYWYNTKLCHMIQNIEYCAFRKLP